MKQDLFKIQNSKFKIPARGGRGFTMIELLVVIGIITVFVGISIGVFSAMRQRNQVDTDSQKIISALRLAQNRALASENLEQHGVHFEISDNSFIVFKGSIYDSEDPDNQIFFLNNRTQFLNIQLAGGAEGVIFNRLSGTTLQDGFVEISDMSDSSQRRIICIETGGALHILDSQALGASCNTPVLEYVDGNIDGDLASFPSDSAFGDPAQSFTVGDFGVSVASAHLYLRRSGFTSDIFLEIREQSTVGNVLGRSLIIDGSSLPINLSWVRFDFTVPVSLSSNTQYFLRLRSLPSSTVAFSGAAGTIIWGYENSETVPPAYAGGDAWRFVGANDNEADQGEQLGPGDQFDFSFKLFSHEPPPNADSRTLDFNLGFSLRNHTTITLTFDGGTSTENITISEHMNTDSTEFDWGEVVDVGGVEQSIRIHSLYIDDHDTILHVHRDGDMNTVSLGIDIDSINLVNYTAGGIATKGTGINSMIYR